MRKCVIVIAILVLSLSACGKEEEFKSADRIQAEQIFESTEVFVPKQYSLQSNTCNIFEMSDDTYKEYLDESKKAIRSKKKHNWIEAIINDSDSYLDAEYSIAKLSPEQFDIYIIDGKINEVNVTNDRNESISAQLVLYDVQALNNDSYMIVPFHLQK